MAAKPQKPKRRTPRMPDGRVEHQFYLPPELDEKFKRLQEKLEVSGSFLVMKLIETESKAKALKKTDFA